MRSVLAEAGVYELTDQLRAELVERTSHDFERWSAQVEHANHCHHPVRLQGRVLHQDKATGEAREVYSTASEPERTLLVACGNRRASVCPSCSSTYKGDARHLVLAGLIGGKGVPDTVRSHPRLFVTFTAPSFGALHTSHAEGKNLKPCHPRRGAERCPHGVLMSCYRLHRPDDDMVGDPICPECFDYQGMVVWNALAPELWRRTIQDIRRGIAKTAGLTRKRCDELVWLQYVKVAEYQRRGAIHFHAVLRLDGAHNPDLMVPPPKGFDAEFLEHVVEEIVPKAWAPDPRGGEVRWGEQNHKQRLTGKATPGELSEEAVAFYVAKYAAKGADDFGASLAHRTREPQELAHLDVRSHIGSAVRIAWILGGREELKELRLREWAHCIGFGGHFATKSRRYSTTFKVLRGARREHRRRQRCKDGIPRDAWDRPEEEGKVRVLMQWAYVGSGYRTTGERLLALSAAARAREAKEAEREDRARELTERWERGE